MPVCILILGDLLAKDDINTTKSRGWRPRYLRVLAGALVLQYALYSIDRYTINPWNVRQLALEGIHIGPGRAYYEDPQAPGYIAERIPAAERSCRFRADL